MPPTLNRYLSVKVEGLESVPRTGPAILSGNHLSFVDSLLFAIQLPGRPLYFIGKAEYWDSWTTRWMAKGTAAIPVERTGREAGEAALAAGMRVLEAGELLGIYPEGTRSPDGRLYKGKTGPARLALRAGVPIIPCGIIGTNIVQPPGKYWLKRHPVTIRYGRPLDLSEYGARHDDPLAARAATDELMIAIMQLTGQTYVDAYAADIKSSAVSAPATAADVTEAAALMKARGATGHG